MAGNISTYLEEELLDHVLLNAAYSSPAAVYAGVVDASANDTDMEAGTLTNELTTYSGDRKAITFDAITQSGGASITANSAALTFESMPSCTVGYVIVCDAATSGNVLFWCPLVANKTYSAGDTCTIAIGDLDISLD